MIDIEGTLREAMHAAVDGERAGPDLLPAVLRRHRRYLIRVAGTTVAGALVLAAVPVAISASGGLRGGPGPAATGSASSSPRSTAAASGSPRPHRSHTYTPGSREPARLRGLPMPSTMTLRMLVTARDPLWFTSPSDVSQPIAGLPRSALPYSLTRVNGGWAAALSPACHCQSARVPVYYIADGSASARRVGVAQEVFAGRARGTIWLQTQVKGAGATTAREVTSSGRMIGSPVRLPGGYTIRQGLGSDLLLSPVSQGPGSVIDKLWDPGTRRVVRTIADVIAASGSQVAWGTCGGCAVHVRDLRTGVTTAVQVPATTWAYDGRFSPDGRYLAVYLSGGITADGYATVSRIAVIDLSTGRLMILPGSSIGNDVPNDGLAFGWSGDSDTLIAAVTGRALTQVGLWRPGSAGLLVRSFWLPPGLTVVTGS